MQVHRAFYESPVQISLLSLSVELERHCTITYQGEATEASPCIQESRIFQDIPLKSHVLQVACVV